MRRVVLAALLCACGGGGSADVDAGPQPDGGTPSFDEAPAYVHLVEQSDNMGSAYSTGLSAAFRTSIVSPYDEVAAAGDCRLLHGDVGYCTGPDPCDGYCTGDGTCVPFPPQVSAGTLTFTGLDQALSVPPVDTYYTWYTEGPAFEPGQEVGVSAAGAEFAAFSLATPAPAPLEVTNLDQLTPDGDQDLVIEWTASGDPAARVYLFLRTDLGHAQVHPVVIQCDAPDTGSLAVPQSMMAEYADPANWSCGDCFSSHMERYTRATTAVDDVTVELRTSSRVSIYLPVY